MRERPPDTGVTPFWLASYFVAVLVVGVAAGVIFYNHEIGGSGQLWRLLPMLLVGELLGYLVVLIAPGERVVPPNRALTGVVLAMVARLLLAFFTAMVIRLGDPSVSTGAALSGVYVTRWAVALLHIVLIVLYLWLTRSVLETDRLKAPTERRRRPRATGPKTEAADEESRRQRLLSALMDREEAAVEQAAAAQATTLLTNEPEDTQEGIVHPVHEPSFTRSLAELARDDVELGETELPADSELEAQAAAQSEDVSEELLTPEPEADLVHPVHEPSFTELLAELARDEVVLNEEEAAQQSTSESGAPAEGQAAGTQPEAEDRGAEEEPLRLPLDDDQRVGGDTATFAPVQVAPPASALDRIGATVSDEAEDEDEPAVAEALPAEPAPAVPEPIFVGFAGAGRVEFIPPERTPVPVSETQPEATTETVSETQPEPTMSGVSETMPEAEPKAEPAFAAEPAPLADSEPQPVSEPGPVTDALTGPVARLRDLLAGLAPGYRIAVMGLTGPAVAVVSPADQDAEAALGPLRVSLPGLAEALRVVRSAQLETLLAVCERGTCALTAAPQGLEAGAVALLLPGDVQLGAATLQLRQVRNSLVGLELPSGELPGADFTPLSSLGGAPPAAAPLLQAIPGLTPWAGERSWLVAAATADPALVAAAADHLWNSWRDLAVRAGLGQLLRLLVTGNSSGLVLGGVGDELGLALVGDSPADVAKLQVQVRKVQSSSGGAS
ncbi:MAG: hypothetical protein HPY69_17455 [Armatimonadetes bacterium]|nr:hypothetical protein [Armatimonadota bacterium]